MIFNMMYGVCVWSLVYGCCAWLPDHQDHFDVAKLRYFLVPDQGHSLEKVTEDLWNVQKGAVYGVRHDGFLPDQFCHLIFLSLSQKCGWEAFFFLVIGQGWNGVQ